MTAGKKVGLVVPPARGRVPPDAAGMYPDTDFLIEGIGVGGMSADGYAQAVGRLEQACATLAQRGAKSILLFGTSLSFFRGPTFNGELEDRMMAASDLPCRTLTSAMTEAFRELGVGRLAVATAYTPEVNAMFGAYFRQEGFAIDAIAGLDLVSLADAEDAGPDTIAALARRVRAEAPDAAALAISCAGLSTSSVCPALEREFDIPVVSSAMVGAWASVRLAGDSGRAPGFGRLFER